MLSITKSFLLTATLPSLTSCFAFHSRRHWHRTFHITASIPQWKHNPHPNNIVRTMKQNAEEEATNLYREWTLDQDKLLYENRYEPLPRLASLLGRGLHGVRARLSKLLDVNSPAYTRLFADNPQWTNNTDEKDDSSSKKEKLVPAGEALRRIRWDASLSPSDFTVVHYDRVEDELVETPMDASNDSIPGKESLFVFALPEHRIQRIKYRERVVWDKDRRLDCIFGEKNIYHVVETYEEWKRKMDEMQERHRRKHTELTRQMKLLLGDTRFSAMKELSVNLQNSDDAILPQLQIEEYVKTVLTFYKEARVEIEDQGLDNLNVPDSELHFLDMFSELVSLLPNQALRERILTEIEIAMSQYNNKPSKTEPTQLPQLIESEITEMYARGSGPGGQKINKTSNKVVLVHEPTKIRVECQDTRSLSRNRKIARKRLRLKLEEYLFGSRSRNRKKAADVAMKKARAKARSKSRLKKKKGAAEQNDS